MKISYNIKYYVGNLLNSGNFKFIPLSRNYYEMYLKGYQKYYICIINGISIYDNNDTEYKLKYVKKHEDLHKESMTSNSDIYAGTLNLRNNKGYKSDINLLLYETEVEVDGLFDILSDIKLSKFQAEILYSNNSDNILENNSLLVYEIKSGDKKEELVEQMNTRCLFIHEFLKSIYNLPIYYIGFYKKKLQKYYR